VRRRERRRALVHTTGELGERLAGPAIRALEFAKALSAEYEVTIAANSDVREHCGIRVVPASRRRLVAEIARHDVIVSPCLPPYLLALRQACRITAVADLYDPHEQELATLHAGRARERALRERAAIQALQLRHADLVLCASERQRTEIVRVARELLAPGASLPDPAVVPFGIPDPPPPRARRALRERFEQIDEHDTVVLWWGSMWRWLDAETPVRAFARLAQASRTDIKLVITAGRPPGKSAERQFDVSAEVRALAEELGVMGRTVLFLEEWIAFDERYDYLRDADIGLTLHRHAAEASLAARARYMDCLCAGLPGVLGGGDETAEELAAGGFATLLHDPEPDALAAALLALADDPATLAAARAAGRSLAAERHWSAVGARLLAALARGVPPRSPSRRTPPLSLLAGAGGYYARRAVDLLSPAG